jgi:phage terminase large subunit-like protein
LPPEAIKAALADLSQEQCEALLHDWRFLAREAQIPPDGDWQNWLILAGRGFGKTRTGAEWVREQVKAGEKRIGLIAPTAADARDIMVEGESGLLSVCWSGDKTHRGEPLGRPAYEPSKRRLTWENGAIATMFSAEEPERLRGPQHGKIWADELAAWKYLRETWDMAMFGLRLGNDPRACITTTPKPLALLRELAADKNTAITRGSTFDNAGNLAPSFLQIIRDKYEGTRLGRQELYAEILDEAEGALWNRALIEKHRRPGPRSEDERQALMAKMVRIVVAIDPSGGSDGEKVDEMGIVVAGVDGDGHGAVLEDVSARLSPDGAARRAISAYDRWGADRIIGEVNNGGEWIGHTIRLTAAAMRAEEARESESVSYRAVHASRGKQTRAEPIAALDEQGRIHHYGGFPELEDQMCTWEPLSGMKSPDRMDARVWAFTALMLENHTTQSSELSI